MSKNAAAIGISLVLMLIVSRRQPLARQVPASDSDSLDRLLARYYATADEYRAAFKNLVAEETRTIERYRVDGSLDKRRQIISDLVVYRPSRGGEASEYRDLREVDGKVVKERTERALKLLTRASTADSLERELKIINDETSKHEFNSHIRGETINVPAPFRERRDAFHVELGGRESLDGRDVVIVRYRQIAPIPGERQARFGGFPEQPRMQQGRLWLDVETGQVRRAELEFTLAHPALQERVPYVRLEQTYGSSPFGILVPQRIVFSTFQLRRAKKAAPAAALYERSTFSYGSFRRFGVTSEEVFAAPGDRK